MISSELRGRFAPIKEVKMFSAIMTDLIDSQKLFQNPLARYENALRRKCNEDLQISHQ